MFRPAKKFDVASFFHEQAEEGDDEEDPEDENNPITEVEIGLIFIVLILMFMLSLLVSFFYSHWSLKY